MCTANTTFDGSSGAPTVPRRIGPIHLNANLKRLFTLMDEGVSHLVQPNTFGSQQFTGQYREFGGRRQECILSRRESQRFDYGASVTII